MRDLFFQSIACQPPRICGRQLLPFSVAHEYFLKALESPYAIGGEISKADVLLAVDVCSRDWASNAARLFGQTSPATAWSKLGRRWMRFDLTTADKSLRTYIADFSACPEHWESDIRGASLRAPWEFHLVRILMQHCGMTECEAWNCPLARARCYADAIGEANGDKTLVSAEEQAAMEGANNG